MCMTIALFLVDYSYDSTQKKDSAENLNQTVKTGVIIHILGVYV